MKSVHLTSLGCPKNMVDSEVMLGLLLAAGYQPVAEPAAAELLLVNTCGFIESAVQEGIDTILALADEKQPGARLVVAGCMVQRYGPELAAELPEVDLFLGTEEVAQIVTRVEGLAEGQMSVLTAAAAPRFLMNAELPRRLATPPHRAYLKVTEGCSNRCSYCLIPSIRGPLRSRPLADILREAVGLAAAGVRELTLVAQDLTAYGFDLGAKGPRLPDLLQGLVQETAIPWIRMLYLYPTRVSDQLLALVAVQPRILPYFDIPLQHVADPVLRAMNRPYGEGEARELIGRIRKILPDAAIRTTFMVGFPGETTADMKRLARFMEECALDHVGIFAYANEEGCAAAALPAHCRPATKKARRDRLMKLQAEISLARNRQWLGRELEVLVEGVSPETELLLEGRAWFQAPEIDGCVYISAGQCRPGELVRVRISDAHPYDLVGEISS